jgi:hypothetical protein
MKKHYMNLNFISSLEIYKNRKGDNMTKPEKVFRAGNCSASVFINEIEKDEQTYKIPKVSLEISYKDKEGEWQSTNRLDQHELPKAILVLSKSYEWIALKSDITDEPQ